MAEFELFDVSGQSADEGFGQRRQLVRRSSWCSWCRCKLLLASTVVIAASVFVWQKLYAAPVPLENCFVLLSHVSRSNDKVPFDASDIGSLLVYFQANLNINGTGAIIASPGDVPALQDCCGIKGNEYAYDWIRDSALSVASLIGFATGQTHVLSEIILSLDTTESIVVAYASWVNRLHAAYPNDDTAFNEPKWIVREGNPDQGVPESKPYQGNWCRPQTDGPPLRARAFIAAAKKWRRKQKEFWSLARKDLDWLSRVNDDHATNVEKESCDLWEETTDGNFLWNRVMMRAALLEGHEFAETIGDFNRSATYLNAAKRFIGDPFATHTQSSPPSGAFVTECPTSLQSGSCSSSKKAIDGAVILSLIHGNPLVSNTSVDGVAMPRPTSQLVAETVSSYNSMFCGLYSVNQKDSKAGVPGVLYGRYQIDRYGSNGGGNPWVLITAALSTLLYQASQVVAGGDQLTEAELAAWRVAFNVVDPASFNGTARDFVRAGDSVLRRLRYHVWDKDYMHLYEQIDRNTGRQYNAMDLTWSYAEVLGSVLERGQAMNLV